MKEKIRNATITSASIRYDRGIFLCPWIFVEGDGWGCGMGGYVCDKKDVEHVGNSVVSLTGFMIMRIMDTVGVEAWEHLAGKNVRVEFSVPHAGGEIVALGHWCKDKWFRPGEEMK